MRCRCTQRQFIQFVFLKSPPADEPQPPFRSERVQEISESARRVSEEHDAKARKDRVECSLLKWIGLRVTADQRDVFRQVSVTAEHINCGLQQFNADHFAAWPHGLRQRARRSRYPEAYIKNSFAWSWPQRRHGSLAQRLELLLKLLPNFEPAADSWMINDGHYRGHAQAYRACGRVSRATLTRNPHTRLSNSDEQLNQPRRACRSSAAAWRCRPPSLSKCTCHSVAPASQWDSMKRRRAARSVSASI